MIKAVFFDLDGTLLPMDQEVFIRAYLGGLVKTLAPKGYDPEAIAKALWKSTGAMMQNDGRSSNEEVFWKSFCAILGEKVREEEPLLEKFYEGDFQKVKDVCGYTEKSKKLVDKLNQAGFTVVLATSPLFPKIATDSRIRWAGLEPSDFAYVTTYENSNYCKPNPTYYTDLLSKMGLAPEECLMVGNDVGDDMIAESIGMPVFLLTDCLINKAERDINDFNHGDFNAMCKFVENLI